MTTPSEMKSRLRALAESAYDQDRDCLRWAVELIDRLPLTADGAPVMLRDIVWCPNGDRPIKMIVGGWSEFDFANQEWSTSFTAHESGNDTHLADIDCCYSTPEAALAAKEDGE